MAFTPHGGRSALEPLEATRQDFGPQSVRGSTMRAPGDFSSAREGLRTAGTMRGNAQLGATSNLSEADNIKVAVRVRPLFPPEKEKGATQVVEVTEDHTLIKLVVPGPAGNKMQRDFAFHACLGPEVSQADVLHMCGIPQLLDAALAGYNVTVFAYGQTGSGKTFTMSGREEVIGTDEYRGGDTNDGIMSRSVGYLFNAIQTRRDQTKFALSASYLEIYNEGIYDLLNLKAKNLPVKWDASQGFYVPGLKSVQCADQHSMLEVIRTAMKHRHVGSHELNIESSRSHSIMTIICSATPLDPNAADFGTTRFGKICFVDLAGSERLKDSKSEGVMLKETANINKSLFVLGKVISALAERDSSGVTSAHIPYRDSKLTKLLMDSLGGCAMALMIATCSPSSLHVEETLSTLSYATRAKNIQNRPVVQYDPKEQQIAALRREIDLLRQENMYLREQLQLGGGVPHTPLRDSMQDLMHSMGYGQGGDSEGGASTPGVTFGEARTMEVPQWPNLVYPGSSHGSRLGSAQRMQPAGGATPHALGSAGSGGGAVPGVPVPLVRSASPRLGSAAMAAPSARASPLAVSFAAASANGGSSGHGHGASSTWSMLEPRCESPMGRGLVGASMDSLPSISGGMGAVASSGGPHDFNRRLKETQALLARFAEENNRLAKENDKLRTTRMMLGNEHADVLDEIDQLRSKLSGLESAVMTGSFSPADVKALLSELKQAGPPPKTGSIMNHLRSSLAPSTAATPGSFGGSLQSTLSNQYGAAGLPTQPFTPSAQLSSLGSSGLPSATLPTMASPDAMQPPGSAGANPDPGQLPSSLPPQPPGQLMAPHPPVTQQPGSAMGRRTSSGGQVQAFGVPSALQPQQPPSAGPHHKQEVANVMAMGSSQQAALRTRQGSMGKGAAGSDGIIVADQAKLSLLLGLGGGGGSAASGALPAPAPPISPSPVPQALHAVPQPPQQPQPVQGMYRAPSLGQAPPGSSGYQMGMPLAGFVPHPGSSHGMAPVAMYQGMAPGMMQPGMMMAAAAMQQAPQPPIMPASMRPLPVKPGDGPLNPAKQAHEQALIRRMLNSGAL